MSRKFLTSLDVSASGVSLIGLTPDSNSSDPVTNVRAGRIYFNNTSNVIKFYNGTSWISLAGTTTINNTSSTAFTISGTSGVVVNTNGAAITASADSTYTFPLAGTSASLGGIPASAYAQLASANFTAASVGGSQIDTLGSNVTITGTKTFTQPITGSISYATNAGNSTTTSQTAFGNISASSLTTSGNVSIGGNIYISGSTTVVAGSTTALIADPIFFLGNGNPANINDLGFVGQYNSTLYTGLLRDPQVSAWRLFSNLSASPTNTANFASVSYDPLYLGGWNVYSSSTTQTASMSPQGYLVAPSANFTSSLQLNGSNVATQSYVTTASVAYATNAGNSASLGGQSSTYYYPASSITTASVAYATNSGSLGGISATSYAQLAAANFTTASVGGIPIASTSYVTASAWSNQSASVGYASSITATASIGGFPIARKYVGTITGNGTSTQFTYNHGLGTLDINAQVYQTSTGPDTQYGNVEIDIVRLNTSSVQVSFAYPPASSAVYNLVIIG